MATTQLSTDSIPVPNAPSTSSWQKFKRSLSTIFQGILCGCYSAEELAEFEMDIQVRSSIREHMLTQEASFDPDEKPLEHAMLTSIKEDEYVMGDF